LIPGGIVPLYDRPPENFIAKTRIVRPLAIKKIALFGASPGNDTEGEIV
jgi:hypothetical protein